MESCGHDSRVTTSCARLRSFQRRRLAISCGSDPLAPTRQPGNATRKHSGLIFCNVSRRIRCGRCTESPRFIMTACWKCSRSCSSCTGPQGGSYSFRTQARHSYWQYADKIRYAKSERGHTRKAHRCLYTTAFHKVWPRAESMARGSQCILLSVFHLKAHGSYVLRFLRPSLVTAIAWAGLAAHKPVSCNQLNQSMKSFAGVEANC